MGWKIVIFLFMILCFENLFSQTDVEVNTNKSKGKLYKFGVGAIQSGDYFLAKAYFDALKDKGFENNEQIYHYAKLLNSLGDFENSNKYIDSLLAKKYDNPGQIPEGSKSYVSEWFCRIFGYRQTTAVV